MTYHGFVQPATPADYPVKGFMLGNGGGNISVNISTETACMTSVPPVDVFYPDGEGAMVWGTVNFTPGAGATGVNYRIRRGAGLSGPTLGPVHSIGGLTAGVPTELPFSYWDDPADRSESVQVNSWLMQYTLTLLQTGAPTATGLINYMTMSVKPTVRSVQNLQTGQNLAWVQP